MTNIVDVTVPVGQAEGTESVVSTWFKAVGDVVTENEPLLEISTDKVNMEVAAPGTGRLVEILKQDGDQVEPGDVLGRVDTASAAAVPAETPPESSPQADGTEKPQSATTGGSTTSGSGELSPAVRKLLKENGLDASEIQGTGRGGRITHQDVTDFVAARGSGASSRPAAETSTAKARGTRPSGIPGRLVPHTQMRRSIAQHMVQSVATAPHVTTVFEADLSAVAADRELQKPSSSRAD